TERAFCSLTAAGSRCAESCVLVAGDVGLGDRMLRSPASARAEFESVIADAPANAAANQDLAINAYGILNCVPPRVVSSNASEAEKASPRRPQSTEWSASGG